MSVTIASLIAKIGADTSNFEAGAKRTKSGLSQMASGFTSAISTAAIYSAGIIAVGNALKATVEKTLEYDNAVRKLAEVSGTGAEEASRLLQVMDDFKLSADDVFMATKAMTKEGLSPTLETLQKLSDQYNQLNPGQERAEFLMTNFGKSGLKFAEAMSKGGDALAQMGQEVEKSLIRTDAQIAKTRLAELAFDKWADKVEALKVEVGSGLIGVLDGSTAAIAKNAQAIFKSTNGYEFNTNQLGRYTDAQRAAWEEANRMATEQYLLANGMDIAAESSNNLTASLEEQEAAAKAISNGISSQISLINDLQSSSEDFGQRYKEINNDASLSDSERIQKLNELTDAENKKTLQFISNILAENLARDGWTQSEFEAFAKQQEAWGLWSSDVVSKAQAAWMEADKITASINAIPSTKTVSVTVQQLGGYNIGSQQYQNIAHAGRAAGGSIAAGAPYMVGERGPEMIVPSSNGNVVSNSKLGDNSDLIAAINANRIDERRLAKAIVQAQAQKG